MEMEPVRYLLDIEKFGKKSFPCLISKTQMVTDKQLRSSGQFQRHFGMSARRY